MNSMFFPCFFLTPSIQQMDFVKQSSNLVNISSKTSVANNMYLTDNHLSSLKINTFPICYCLVM